MQLATLNRFFNVGSIEIVTRGFDRAFSKQGQLPPADGYGVCHLSLCALIRIELLKIV